MPPSCGPSWQVKLALYYYVLSLNFSGLVRWETKCSQSLCYFNPINKVYSIKYGYNFILLCLAVIASLSYAVPCDLFTHILQGCFTYTEAGLHKGQWSIIEGYEKTQTQPYQTQVNPNQSQPKHKLCTYLMGHSVISVVVYLPIFFRAASQALGQHCPSACEASLKGMGKSHQYQLSVVYITVKSLI